MMKHQLLLAGRFPIETLSRAWTEPKRRATGWRPPSTSILGSWQLSRSHAHILAERNTLQKPLNISGLRGVSFAAWPFPLRLRAHRLGLERPVAGVEIGLGAALALDVEQLLAKFVGRGMRERAERPLQ